jgi:hypothetical protein
LDAGNPAGGLGASFTMADVGSYQVFGTSVVEITNNIGVIVSPGDGSTNVGSIEFPPGLPPNSIFSITVSYTGSVTVGGPANGPTSSNMTDQSINLDVTSLDVLNIPQGNQSGNQLGGTLPVQANFSQTWYVILGDTRLPSLLVIDYENGFKYPASPPSTNQLIINQCPLDFIDWLPDDDKKKSFDELLRISEPDLDHCEMEDEQKGVAPAQMVRQSVSNTSALERLRLIALGSKTPLFPKKKHIGKK